jgi:hypothetical protein
MALVAVLHFLAFWAYFGLLALATTLNSSLKIPWLTQVLGNYTWIMPLFFPGFMQVFYVLPVMMVLRQRRYLAVVKGMAIGAVITMFLNGVCFMGLGR